MSPVENNCNFPDVDVDDSWSKCLTDDSFDALRTQALTLYPLARSCFTMCEAR